jgi:hypothetical protein
VPARSVAARGAFSEQGLAVQGLIAAVGGGLRLVDGGLLASGQGEEALGLGERGRDQRLGDPVIVDVEEAVSTAGLAQRGGNVSARSDVRAAQAASTSMMGSVARDTRAASAAMDSASEWMFGGACARPARGERALPQGADGD